MNTTRGMGTWTTVAIVAVIIIVGGVGYFATRPSDDAMMHADTMMHDDTMMASSTDTMMHGDDTMMASSSDHMMATSSDGMMAH